MTPEQLTAQDAALRSRQRRLGFFYLLMPLLLIYLVFKVLPPYPWPTEQTDTAALAEAFKSGDQAKITEQLKKAVDTARPVKDQPITFLRGTISVSTSLEERLLLLVIIAGAFGSFVHGATSFSTYVGNREFTPSWTWWYVLRPLIGVGLALVIYFAVRGGLLLLVVSGATDASKINPFGVAALAGLTGMFSKQATDKLNEVFTTLFKSAEDAKRKDSLAAAPKVEGVTPDRGPAAGGQSVTVVGTSFSAAAKVLFGGQSATDVVVAEGGTSLTARTPAHEAGLVAVEVVNADEKRGSKAEAYTYEDEVVSPPV